jgi:AAA family ATP:ADP antiporter
MVEKVVHGIERLVGADVSPDERRLVLLFFFDLLLLLTAYYILKVVREPLILLSGGAVSRSYARGLQALLLTLLVPIYSMLANRLEPARLVNWVNAFFIACLVLFVALSAAGLPIGFPFFVWLGIFSTMAIAQFWSLANDLLTQSEGKRLFPLVAVGGTLGGIAGSQIAAHSMARLSLYQLMLMAAALLCCCMLLTHAGRKAALNYRRRVPRDEAAPDPSDSRGGFTLVLSERYLLLIGMSVLLLNLINTTGDFVLADMVNNHARTVASGSPSAVQIQQQTIAAFYGNFQTAVTTLTALIQILLVARLFKVAGVSPLVLFLPAFVIVSYGASALAPALALIAIVKITENSADYSLQNTVQQALFLPTSRDVKYKAKAAIDTFIVRAGDLASTALVAIGVHAGFGRRAFAIANVVLGSVWFVISWYIGRGYRQLSNQMAEPKAEGADGLAKAS